MRFLILSIFLVLFIGCGDSGLTEFEQKYIREDIKNCTSDNDIENYQIVYSNNEIVKVSSTVNISTILFADGTKRICVESGEAYILRK